MKNKWLCIFLFFVTLLTSACSQLDNYAEPAETLTGKILANPERADIDTDIKEQLIVEFYSR